MPKMTKSGRGAGTAVETKELRALRKAREEVAAQYKVSGNGIVRDPGPLEGQPLYVAHYFDAEEADEEFADEFSRDVAVIFPSDDDRVVFPELSWGGTSGVVNVAALWIWETDSGLVLSRAFMSEAEEKSARDEIDQARDDEGEDGGEEGEEDDESDEDPDPDEDEPEDEPPTPAPASKETK